MIYIYITNYVIFSETPMNSTCEGAMVIPARARLRVRAWEGQLHALGGLQGRGDSFEVGNGPSLWNSAYF